jgi:phage-related protein
MVDFIFAPPVNPAFPLDDDHQPKINVAQFGDGYSARSPDGLNWDLENPSLVWDNLTEAEYKAIWQFLVQMGGYQSFYYTVPFDSGSGWYTCALRVQANGTYTSLHFAIEGSSSPFAGATAFARPGQPDESFIFNSYSMRDVAAPTVEMLPDQLFAGTNWVKTDASIVSSYDIGPNGELSSWRQYDVTSGNVSHYNRSPVTTAITAGKQYDLKAVLKAGGIRFVRMYGFFNGSGGTDGMATFDLRKGVVAGTANAGGPTVISSSITPISIPAKTYICPTYKRSRSEAGAWRIDATFKEITGS